MEMAWRILSPLQRLQGLGRLLIVRIKDESGLVFLRCAIQLPFTFVEFSEPLVDC